MAFRAFLDGTQRSEAVTYVGGIPIVLGSTAAIVRERRNRRLHSWRPPLRSTRLYAPYRRRGAHPCEKLTSGRWQAKTPTPPLKL